MILFKLFKLLKLLKLIKYYIILMELITHKKNIIILYFLLLLSIIYIIYIIYKIYFKSINIENIVPNNSGTFSIDWITKCIYGNQDDMGKGRYVGSLMNFSTNSNANEKQINDVCITKNLSSNNPCNIPKKYHTLLTNPNNYNVSGNKLSINSNNISLCEPSWDNKWNDQHICTDIGKGKVTAHLLNIKGNHSEWTKITNKCIKEDKCGGNPDYYDPEQNPIIVNNRATVYTKNDPRCYPIFDRLSNIKCESYGRAYQDSNIIIKNNPNVDIDKKIAYCDDPDTKKNCLFYDEKKQIKNNFIENLIDASKNPIIKKGQDLISSWGKIIFDDDFLCKPYFPSNYNFHKKHKIAGYRSHTTERPGGFFHHDKKKENKSLCQTILDDDKIETKFTSKDGFGFKTTKDLAGIDRYRLCKNNKCLPSSFKGKCINDFVVEFTRIDETKKTGIGIFNFPSAIQERIDYAKVKPRNPTPK